jgi:hypothetical protein
MKILQAIPQRMRGIAREIACKGFFLAILASTAAYAGTSAYLNIVVKLNSIARVLDLYATTPATPGAVNLTWTEPAFTGITNPRFYDVRISSTAQINNDADFAAAKPLSSFSPSTIPSPGPGGFAAGFSVTGLAPGTTYFFAIREYDSTVPPIVGSWLRNVSLNQNATNYAMADFSPGAPNAITNLTAAGGGLGQADLTWTAPSNPNGVALTSYTLVYSSQSIAQLGGNTTNWFDLATATDVVITPVHSSGTLESEIISGLTGNVTYYFGIKTTDVQGEVSNIDTESAGIATQASFFNPGAQGAPNAITNLTASTVAAFGQADLTWTAPVNPNGVTMASYTIVYSSVSIASLGGNTTNWFNLATATQVVVAPVHSSGTLESLVINGLSPLTTYYFAIKSVDVQGQVSDIDTKAAGIATQASVYIISEPGAPNAITNLTAAAGALLGQADLTWTAPANPNGVAMSSYTLVYSTQSVIALGGNTTNWFNLATATQVVIVPVHAPGTLESLVVNGLTSFATYYFGIKSADVLGEVSNIDTETAGLATQASLLVPGVAPPATPAGLSAAAGLNKVVLNWNSETAAQMGLDFGFYRIFRSTYSSINFVAITTTTNNVFVDQPLIPFVTYYYKLSAAEPQVGGQQSVLTSTVSAVPFSVGPMEPFGLNVNSSSNSITFSWTPTTRFPDGTPFLNISSPSIYELTGYRVLRSSAVCVTSTFTVISTMTYSVTTASDTTAGNPYFYLVQSFNAIGVSTQSTVISSFGDRHFLLGDCATDLTIPASQAPSLNANTNSIGDIQISRRLRPEDVGGEVYQSAQFMPMLNGVTPLPNFYLPAPANIVLHYQTSGGSPVGDTTGMSLRPGAGSDGNLGMYWFNNQQFNKMYGNVDTVDQTVSVQSPNLGIYQIRSQLRSTTAVFDISNISGRVITPNGDGLNDQVIFTYDPGPNNATPSGAIYDVRGAFVANMTGGLVPNTLIWDGKASGRTVTSGVYVYQIKGDSKTFTGTIVVAR